EFLMHLQKCQDPQNLVLDQIQDVIEKAHKEFKKNEEE
ncbi:TPA: TlyA family rRNA (cytidine-2'-O)-methyltransferase, partial [Streptococcus agalactiae]